MFGRVQINELDKVYWEKPQMSLRYFFFPFCSLSCLRATLSSLA